MNIETDNSLSKSRYRSPNGESRIYKDGNRYKLRVRVDFKDGSHAFVVGSGQTMISCQSNTKRLVSKKISEFEASQTKPFTVAAYCTHWLNNVRGLRQIAYKTKVGYETAIRKHIVPLLGDILITELTRENIQSAYAALSTSGKSRSVIKEVRAVLFGALDEAVLSGLIPHNVARSVKIEKKKKSIPNFLTEEEVKRVLEAAESRGELALWGVALIMAIRQGERLALRWSDLELDGDIPVMSIRNNLLRKTGVGLVLEAPKTECSIRDLVIPSNLVAALKAHKKSQLEARLRAGKNWREQDFVFTGEFGAPVDPANDRKNWLSLLEAAEVKRVRLHDARHTAATLMHAMGHDIHTISKILGHSSISTTAEYYAHVVPATSLRALNDLDRLMV